MGTDYEPSVSSTGMTRIVRFDNECVLIPERSKPKIMHLQTYTLPLWKRRPPSPEDTHIVFKLPIPTFSKSPPIRTTHKPLSPCLVHREYSPASPRTPTRSPSLPLPTTPHTGSTPLTTVPLRACCPDCFPITEACLKEGAIWQEKFSRGARRRRSVSLDSASSDPFAPSSAPVARGFAAIACPTAKNTTAVVTASFGGTSPCTITVDEVDKRRRSQDSPATSPSSPCCLAKHLPREREPSASSLSSTDSDLPPSPTCPALLRKPSLQHLSKPRASPIAELDEEDDKSKSPSPVPPRQPEDDEDQLFPLPSPRRSPCVSPVPPSLRSRSSSSIPYGGSRSPSIRSSPSPVPSPIPSIPPSPNTSQSCLIGAGIGGSKDSLKSTSSGSSSSSRLGSTDSLKRVLGRRKDSAKERESKRYLSLPSVDRPARETPNVACAKPDSLARPTDNLDKPPSPSPPSHSAASISIANPTSTPDVTPTRPLNPLKRSNSTSPLPPLPPPSTTTPTHRPSSRSRSLSSPPTPSATSSSTPAATPTPSPMRTPSTPAHKKRRTSFNLALPLPKPGVILRAGSGVLRGVSSMGMGGGTGV